MSHHSSVCQSSAILRDAGACPYRKILSGSPLRQQWWSSFNVAPSEREAKTTFQRLHFGFSALPAGNYNGSYNNFGNNANYWSATENDSSNAYNRNLNYNNANVNRNNNNKNNGFSVRCVRD